MHRPEQYAVRGQLVADWFGAEFSRLHPALQALHRSGGHLRSEVEITYGNGLDGWLGRRMARRIGLPAKAGRHGFEVTIRHQAGAMAWIRRFDDGAVLASTFRPVGYFPDDYWSERSGPLAMRLGVDTGAGGWRWHLRGLRVFGIPLPHGLLGIKAYKRIEADGRYRFHVGFAMPGVGSLFRYEGLLHAMPQAGSCAVGRIDG